ncbi:MAG: hypothetical protein ACYCOU_01780 [Sulfobacillus sp.]
MTAEEIAQSLHGKRAGKRWMCRCPRPLHRHGDRNRSLSVWESEDGWVRLKCFAGCDRDDILAALGLKVRDLAVNSAWKRSPEWSRQQADRKQLKKLERRLGLAMFAGAIIPEERPYWGAAERNIHVEIRALRDRMFPEEALQRSRETKLRRAIARWGWDGLMERWCQTERGKAALRACDRSLP